MSASRKISIISTLDQLATSREPTDAKGSSNLLSANYSVVLGSTLTGPAKDLVDRLALLLCGNNLSEDKKSLITSTIVGMSVATQIQQQNRVAVALQLIFRSTEFWTL